MPIVILFDANKCTIDFYAVRIPPRADYWQDQTKDVLLQSFQYCLTKRLRNLWMYIPGIHHSKAAILRACHNDHHANDATCCRPDSLCDLHVGQLRGRSLDHACVPRNAAGGGRAKARTDCALDDHVSP